MLGELPLGCMPKAQPESNAAAPILITKVFTLPPAFALDMASRPASHILR
jgi:hypothetical protein